jgi:cyclopropane-fatty-acyl-phospholipid synthase
MFAKMATADETLFGILDRALTSHRMRFVLPDRTWDVGRTALASSEPSFVVRVTDTDFSGRVLRGGNLGVAESFMDGLWTMETGTLEDLLGVFVSARMDEVLRKQPLVLARVALMRAQHVFTGARANIERHYDAGNDVYELFLDETMGYTCGYQKSPDDTLLQLQENKYERICEKIRLKEGDTLLDIGCGWGGLMIHAAQHHGAKVRGVTLAKGQAEFAMQRARALGLGDRVSVDLGDFRDTRGVYDKIVSVGMFEHLYPHEHGAYFKYVEDHLKDDGFGLVHFMGCLTDHNEPDPFIQKYVFPGSTHPRLSSVITQIEKRRGLGLLDVENIGAHYLPTARYWHANWHANKHRLDATKYDARFVKMYDYIMAIYVAACTARLSALFQVLFTKDYPKNLPAFRI